jgi:enoyl-CoA hydratase/carnithine racemase
MATVRQERSAGLLHIQLSRPEKRNAIDDIMFEELGEAAEAARDDPDLAAVVLTGAGASFCAGLDFSVHQTLAREGAAGERPYANPSDPSSSGLRRPGRGQRIVRALRDCPAPVIVAVQGHAIGGGLQLALAADIRIVAPDAVLASAEIEFGMTVDMGGSALLPRLIGHDRAMDLLLTGQRVTGRQADRWGLVTRLVDDPIAEAHSLAQIIAKRSRRAVLETKRLCRLAESMSVDDSMLEELSVMSANIGSPEQVQAANDYFAARAARDRSLR